MKNLIQCIQIAREEMALRKKALEELNDVNTQHMNFKETDLCETIVLRGKIMMNVEEVDGEMMGVDIQVLDTENEVFDIEIFNLDTGITQFTDEVKGTEHLKNYFKAINSVLIANANGVY